MVGHSVDRCHRYAARAANGNKEDKGKENGTGKGIEKEVLGAVDQLPMENTKQTEEWQIKADRRRNKRATSPVSKEAPAHNRFEVLSEQNEETTFPKIVDILDQVMVAVNEGDGFNGQSSSSVEQRLLSLDRRMQADRVIEQVVTTMTKDTQTVVRAKDGLSIVTAKLAQASERGAKPVDFVVTKGVFENLDTMNRVAHQSWDDVVESESETEDLSGDLPPEQLNRSQ